MGFRGHKDARERVAAVTFLSRSYNVRDKPSVVCTASGVVSSVWDCVSVFHGTGISFLIEEDGRVYNEAVYFSVSCYCHFVQKD